MFNLAAISRACRVCCELCQRMSDDSLHQRILFNHGNALAVSRQGVSIDTPAGGEVEHSPNVALLVVAGFEQGLVGLTGTLDDGARNKAMVKAEFHIDELDGDSTVVNADVQVMR